MRVPVTDRGELVAYLVPAGEGATTYQRPVAAGHVRAAVGNLLDLLPDPMLRSLDAIHLATALQLGQDLEALVTYDSRLAAAAKRQQLPVVTP